MCVNDTQKCTNDAKIFFSMHHSNAHYSSMKFPPTDICEQFLSPTTWFNDSPQVELLKLLPPHLVQTGTLVGAHQRPVAIVLHPLHEEVRDPEGIEQVSSPWLLLPSVLLQVQELEDVGMPRLKVDGKGTGSLRDSNIMSPIPSSWVLFVRD